MGVLALTTCGAGTGAPLKHPFDQPRRSPRLAESRLRTHSVSGMRPPGPSKISDWLGGAWADAGALAASATYPMRAHRQARTAANTGFLKLLATIAVKPVMRTDLSRRFRFSCSNSSGRRSER